MRKLNSRFALTYSCVFSGLVAFVFIWPLSRIVRVINIVFFAQLCNYADKKSKDKDTGNTEGRLPPQTQLDC